MVDQVWYHGSRREAKITGFFGDYIRVHLPHDQTRVLHESHPALREPQAAPTKLYLATATKRELAAQVRADLAYRRIGR